ncbi:8-amino-7-oxononanoate synthase [Ochromonadaceae sp. CCMP2298]|nr:8-amino-7-oxononanoate synthase [Ochromonadaceae sp. CCMP2298]
MNSYQKDLQKRKEQHLLRTLPLPPEGIDFYSNDYLGLAKSKILSQKIEEEYQAISNRKNGASGSRLLSGNSNYSESVERKIADFHNAESALIYSSGYAANIGLISSLATKETTLFTDELIHASLIDGARLGHSKKVRFAHNDPSDLEQKLKKVDGQKLVIVESIYSMDGDVCPLGEIAAICKKQNAMLIVDEAHSVAVMGKNGEGFAQSIGLEDQVLARVMTYGKGPGIHGATVVGPAWLRYYQINFSRSMIFSTAPSDHQFASISAMYDVLPEVETERQQLKSITEYFTSKRKESVGQWLDSNSQIQSLIVPGNEQVVSMGEKLQDAGINALPIRKPSVAEGAERIRFCLHSYNSAEEIDLLFRTLTSP